MKSTLKTNNSTGNSIVWIGILFIILLVALKFVVGELKYYSFNEDILGRFWSIKWVLIGHLTGGALALVIGPFQFWKSLRTKYLKWHRNLGKVYLIAILIGSLCSIYMAWTTALAVHWTWALSLQALGLAWIATAFMAYRAVKKKKIQMHKEWMIRSYIVTFAFVLFRWMVDLPFVVELGNFIERAPTVGWVSWVIPLGIAELIMHWKKME